MKTRGTTIAAAAFSMLACAHSANAQQDASLAELEAAATRGDAQAIVALAAKYENADGVRQDYSKSNELYCKAAALGEVQAVVRLGLIYSRGRGVPRDEGIAAELFSRAADRGDANARQLLQQVSRQAETVMPACLNQEPPPRAAAQSNTNPDKNEIEALVQRLAPEYAVDPQLVMAVISAESSFNARAVSPKNAQGLMQLIPETAQRFGVTHTYDAVDNLKGGLAYLQWLMAFFKGNVALVLAAYNAGEHEVERYRGIPPYAETRAYVRKITSVYKKPLHPYLAQITAPSQLLGAMRRSKLY